MHRCPAFASRQHGLGQAFPGRQRPATLTPRAAICSKPAAIAVCLQPLDVFGNNYPTPDGTGVRDYIHVVNLAEGHLRAPAALQTRTGAHVWNLGTGQGYSVLEMVRVFEAVSGQPAPYRIAPRRPGDIATCYADQTKAERELGWKAQRGLQQMMQDAWRWQSMNPDGYR